MAARLLADLGVGLDNARARVEAIVGMGAADLASGRCRWPLTAGELRFAPRAKRVLQRAAVEADRRHHARVGDVHLLLGIVAEKEGVAAGVLAPGWRGQLPGLPGPDRRGAARAPRGLGRPRRPRAQKAT
jgi:ATP-dependent Clp protease ATP-binding subunit ClpC